MEDKAVLCLESPRRAAKAQSFSCLLHLSQKRTEGPEVGDMCEDTLIRSVSVITSVLPTPEAKTTQGSSTNTGQEYSPIQHS